MSGLVFGAGEPTSITGHVGGLMPELLGKDLAELFVHPVALDPDDGGPMDGKGGGGGGIKGRGSKARQAKATGKNSSMKAARRSNGPSAMGPVLRMQLPHLGDGGVVQVMAQVCVAAVAIRGAAWGRLHRCVGGGG